MANESQQKDSSGWIVIAILFALLWFGGGNGRQDDGNRPTPAPVILEGALLVNVLEKKSITADQELALRESDAIVTEKKMIGHRDLDDDLPEIQPLIQAVKSRFSIDPPFSALQRDGKLLKAAPLVNVAAIKELCK